MGCSASTQNPSAIASSDEHLVGQPRAKRDPPADKHLAGESPGGRFEAPFSGAVVEALPALRVSREGKLQFASLSPALLILDDLLSSEECDGLVALASGGAFVTPRGSSCARVASDSSPLVSSRLASLSRHRWACVVWKNVA